MISNRITFTSIHNTFIHAHLFNIMYLYVDRSRYTFFSPSIVLTICTDLNNRSPISFIWGPYIICYENIFNEITNKYIFYWLTAIYSQSRSHVVAFKIPTIVWKILKRKTAYQTVLTIWYFGSDMQCIYLIQSENT